MQITDIQPQKKNQKKVNIYIDGSFAFGMYQRDAASLGLCAGKELTNQELLSIKETVILRMAKETALNLLSRRDYSCKAMREKLMEKQLPEDVVESTISFLLEYGYLDDGAYAKRYVKYHGESKGKHRLRQELRQKGVEEETIIEALSELASEDVLFAMVERKVQTLPEGYTSKEIGKLKNFFLRRGFSYDEINTCFDRAMRDREQ